MKRSELISLAERIERIRQSVEEACPNCFDAEFPGFKRGMRCEVCGGSARVENKEFDPGVKAEAADFLRQIAEAQPVAWTTEEPDGNDYDGTYSGRVRSAVLGAERPDFGVMPLYHLPLED